MKDSHQSVIDRYKALEEGFARALCWKELSGDTSINPNHWYELISIVRRIAWLVRDDLDKSCKEIETLCRRIWAIRKNFPPINDFNEIVDAAGQLENAAIWVWQDLEKQVDAKYTTTDDNPYPWVNLISVKDFEPKKFEVMTPQTVKEVRFTLDQDLSISLYDDQYTLNLPANVPLLITEQHFVTGSYYVSNKPEGDLIKSQYCLVEMQGNQIQIGGEYFRTSHIKADHIMDEIKYALNNMR